MKHFLLLFLLTLSISAATIDTKLYDEKERTLYYKEIQQQIDKSIQEKTKNSSTIKDELFQLSRVREASLQKISVEKLDFSKIQKQSSALKHYYATLSLTASLKDKEEKYSQMIGELQSKLLFLKKMIENITEEERVNLLSYQLQFAYYKIQQKNLELKIALFKEQKIQLKEILLKSMNTLLCNEEKKIHEKLSNIEKALLDKSQEIVAQELQKEKALIEENNSIELIEKKTLLLNTQYQELSSQKISLNIMQAVCLLKEEDSSGFYKLINTIQEGVETLTNESTKNLFKKELTLLKDISKIALGRTKLFFGATIEESKNALLEVKDFLFSPLFIFNERAISLSSLFMAILYIVFGFFIGTLYKKWIARLTSRWKDISMMSLRLISNIGYYLIVLIFFIISIGSLGIDMSSLSLIAGALSIGIGFGLQTVVSNLIAGIILMFERTIRIGDIIEINNTLSGTVTDMRIRSTTIKTFDNIDIVVPNSSFIQNNVINLTLEDRIRRLHIPFGVAYDTEIDDVKRAVLETLEKSNLIYIRENPDQKPDIRMTMMNSSSVDLELIVWVNRDPKAKVISIESDFLILIYNTLRANNIAIPFPQLDLRVKEMPERNI